MEITVTEVSLVVAFRVGRIDADGEGHRGLLRCSLCSNSCLGTSFMGALCNY